MAATAVEQALVEVRSELGRIDPIHEGLRDFYSLDIKPDTKQQVSAAIDMYDARVSLLRQVEAALVNLLEAGYPVLDIPPVEKAVFDDLTENQATIAAALAQFSVNEATTLTVVPGTPEDK